MDALNAGGTCWFDYENSVTPTDEKPNLENVEEYEAKKELKEK